MERYGLEILDLKLFGHRPTLPTGLESVIAGGDPSNEKLNFYVANNNTGGATEADRKTLAMTILGNGNVGIGTTTPSSPLQVTTPSSNATTTLEFGKALQNKGTCIIMYDQAGTQEFLSVKNGALVVSTTSCQ